MARAPAPPLTAAQGTAPTSLTWFYVGALMGPLGGGLINVLLPILQRDFHTSLELVTFSVTAYMLPYAVFQLFSGAASDIFSRRTVLVVGYAAFALTMLAAVFAPTIASFLVVRALQGAANAFITPVLMAALGDVVPPARLGKAMGLFAAFNTSGQFFAPLLAGWLALIDWRLSFAVVAGVALFLTGYYQRWYARRPALRAARLVRPTGGRFGHLRHPRMALLCASSFLTMFGPTGLAFLIAVYLHDRWRLGPDFNSLILAEFGLAGILLAPWAGWAADRIGRRATSALGVALAAGLFLLMPWVGALALFALLFFALGAASALAWAGINTLAVESFPAQRGAASSLFQAFKFLGLAVMPFAYTPIYAGLGAPAAWGTAALVCGLLLVVLWALGLTRGEARPAPAAPVWE